MIIPGISIDFFAALTDFSFPSIPMCAGTLHSIFFYYLMFGVLLGYHISGLILDEFFVVFNRLRVYILPIFCLLFYASSLMLLLLLSFWQVEHLFCIICEYHCKVYLPSHALWYCYVFLYALESVVFFIVIIRR